MRFTTPLCLPPKFHFWKDFGAGKKRKIYFYRAYWSIWRNTIMRKPVLDYTLKPEKLPPGSKIIDAEDLMEGHIDSMPDEILKIKNRKTITDHPWPYNVTIDPAKSQESRYLYDIDVRLFRPILDCQVLTNTLIEDDKLVAKPDVEPSAEELEIARRQYRWSTSGDSQLVRQPKTRSFPKINLKPRAIYGISKERKEMNILRSMSDLSQTILSKHYHDEGDKENFERILSLRSVVYPHCHVPYSREGKKINLDLSIESMSLTSQSPLKPINEDPESTRARAPISITPRTWRSILEQSRVYTPDWSFTLPQDGHLHTIYLSSRIRRNPDQDEMMARSIIHAFGIASQYARFKKFEREALLDRAIQGISVVKNVSSPIMQDPLALSDMDDDQYLSLDKPIVVQTVAFEMKENKFHFTRYQLNTTQFNDSKEDRIKNQVWYSGPIDDLNEALRYCIDFHSIK